MRPLTAAALVLLLLVSCLGEGGAQPLALLVWHGLLALILVAVLVRPAPFGSSWPAYRPSAAFVLFFALALIQSVFVSYWYAAWLVLLELAAFAAVVVLAAVSAKRLLGMLAWPLLAAGALESCLALGQALAPGVERAAGTFLNPNHLAAWLAAALLVFWGRALGSPWRSRGATLLGCALSLFVLTGLALTGSRGGACGLAAGAATLAFLSRHRLGAASRRLLLIGGCLLLSLGAGVALWRLSQADPFRYHRLHIWRASLGTVLDSPWMGSGPGQFAAASRNLQFADGVPPLRYDKSFSSPHSDALRLPCEFGWPATLLLLLGLALALGELRSSSQRDGGLPPEADGAMAALAALAVQALVENLTQRPAVYLLAGALAGCLLSGRAIARAPRPALAMRLAAASLLGLLFIVGDVSPYLAWHASRQLPTGELGPTHQSRLERALARNELHPELWLRRAEQVAAATASWNIEQYARAREAAEHALRLHPAGARYHRGMARIEALACRTLFHDVDTRSRARLHYERAHELERYDPFILLELGAFLLDTGDPAGAMRAAERALELEPEAVTPRLLLADALLEASGPQGVARASSLLQEARDKAAHWASARRESAYASELLRLEPGLLARIESKMFLAAAQAPR